MRFLAELLLEVVFEGVCYGLGRGLLLLVAPHHGVGSYDEPRKHRWSWHGWTFERDGRRYFHVEAVELTGALLIVVVILLACLANYLAG